MDVRAHNRTAWNRCVEEGNRWTIPVSSEEIGRARNGEFKILLTPSKFVPDSWFPPLKGTDTLCLASGGGQQVPILAAAGAVVTVLDNSPNQLARDQEVADREGLQIRTVEGTMADLSAFSDRSFDFIFHPCSNVFCDNIRPVWKECYRVIRPGGILMTGFTNPVRYIFDDERSENGKLDVRYSLPYSDLDNLDDPRIKKLVDDGEPLEFGHTLEDQMGGQLSAGFVLTDMFEDRYSDSAQDPISKFMATFIATRAQRPAD